MVARRNTGEETNALMSTSLKWAHGFVSPENSTEIAASESEQFCDDRASPEMATGVVMVTATGFLDAGRLSVP